MRYFPAELAHPHVDDMDFLAAAVAVEEIVVLEFDFEFLPLAGFLETLVPARTQKRLLHHFDVPPEVFSHLGILDELVKLVRLVFAVDRGALNLPFGGACSTRDAKLGKSRHAPAPVNLVLEIADADTVRDELVGKHLMVELKFLPLFESAMELLGQHTLPLDLLFR